MYGNYFFKQDGMPFVKARFQNIYGPREFLGAGVWRGTINTIWRNVIPTFIWKALNGEKLYLDNDGMTSRDFIYVEDVVRGLIKCAEKGAIGEAYNLATGVETKIKDLANIILEIVRSKSKIVLLPKRGWDNSGNRFGSTTKSESELGFKSQIDLTEGITQTVSWTKNNRDNILSFINKHKSHLR
jgi:nucleoside-diphosphate-sugar epimerase